MRLLARKDEGHAFLSMEFESFYMEPTQGEVNHAQRMTRQYLAVLASSSSPAKLFSSVGIVKSDLRGSLLDTTLIDVMWDKQTP